MGRTLRSVHVLRTGISYSALLLRSHLRGIELNTHQHTVSEGESNIFQSRYTSGGIDVNDTARRYWMAGARSQLLNYTNTGYN